MYNELTEKDIEKMKEELDERVKNLRPELIEEVKRTRAFGDLSENYEYKAAKQAKNRNDSRIRYLENMIKTAKVIKSGEKGDGTAGLFDKVTIYMPEDDERQVIRVVTTVRCDPLSGFISKESPLGKAVLGKKAGDSFTVTVSKDYSYRVDVISVEHAEDDGSAPLMQY